MYISRPGAKSGEINVVRFLVACRNLVIGGIIKNRNKPRELSLLIFFLIAQDQELGLIISLSGENELCHLEIDTSSYIKDPIMYLKYSSLNKNVSDIVFPQKNVIILLKSLKSTSTLSPSLSKIQNLRICKHSSFHKLFKPSTIQWILERLHLSVLKLRQLHPWMCCYVVKEEKENLLLNFSTDILKPVYGNASLQTAVKSYSEAHS